MKLLADPFARKVTGWSQLRSMAVDSFSVEAATVDPVVALRVDPCRVFEPLNVMADSWQRDVLSCTAKSLMLLCSRQAGKSFVMAAAALVEALVYPHAEVLIVSRTLRQAVELMRKIKELLRGLRGERVNRRRGFVPETLKAEVVELEGIAKAKGWDGAALIGDDFAGKIKDKALSIDLPNGSRITALPGNPDNIVSFSAVTLLIIDEASRVPDVVMHVTAPFLAATEAVHGRPGRKVVASTPFGKRGWFWEAWDRTERGKEAYSRGIADKAAGISYCPYNEQDAERRVEREHWFLGHDGEPSQLSWQTIRVTAEQCPRISKVFLDDERAQLGDRWFRQEYFCSFENLVDAVFSFDDVHAMIDSSIEPMKLWCD